MEQTTIPTENTNDVRGSNPVQKMVNRAMNRMRPRIDSGVRTVMGSEPVVEAGAGIIESQSMEFVQTTLPAELRSASQEAESLGTTYQLIRERISLPTDGTLKRIFKSFLARGLTAAVKISALIGGSVLSGYTNEPEGEKHKYPSYFESLLRLFLVRGRQF